VAIIAKRSPRLTAVIERTIYEEFLPNLPLTAPQYYGCVDEPDGESCWLFLEEVTGKRYRCHDAEHRTAAARWLGIMNTSASGIAATSRLPRRRPGHYLSILQSARETILSNLCNPAFDAEDRALLEKVIAHCDILDAQWSELAGVCGGMPQTLIHGDFNDNNVIVRTDRAGVVILPVDWGKAGWGVPAEDISTVDLTAYWSTVRDHWPSLNLQDLRLLADVGKVFRCLIFLNWIAPRLESVEQPMQDLRNCECWLDALIRAETWRE
jgi:hypothetical protein